MFVLFAISASIAGGSSGGSSYDSGYWGSDGYYNPTERERNEAVRRANEWMLENW